MNKEDFKILKRAFKNQANENELKKIKLSTPLIAERIDILLGEVNLNTNFSDIVQKFSTLENSVKYKDELVITFLLFLGKILNHELLIHKFISPQSESIFNWIFLYENLVFSIVTLMYNKKITAEDRLNMQVMLLALNKGNPSSIRIFLQKLRILTIPNEPIEMELKYKNLIMISSEEFGPFYWRMLHFMAEAINLRKNCTVAKSIWKDFVNIILYRTLMCSICKHHYKIMSEKFKSELIISDDYAKLWYKIHNEINNTLKKTVYTSIEFEKDQSIMQNLLAFKKEA